MSYNANFPVSLDSLSNPSTTTNRNDPGFELHGVIGRLQDIVEALEAKVGIGASTPPATAAVLRRTTTGASAWGLLQTADLAPGAAASLQQVPFSGATTTTSALGAISGSGIGLVAATGRAMELGVSLYGLGSTVATNITLNLTEGAGTALALMNDYIAASQYYSRTVVYRFQPTAGPHSYFLSWSTSTGGSSLSINSGLIWLKEIQ